MPYIEFIFNPPTGLRDVTAFPTRPLTEAEARDQFQSISDQIKNKLNYLGDIFNLHERENEESFALVALKSYVDNLVQSVASGAPKGVYATLAELQTAFPAGAEGIYLVTADGKWYFWNGAWTAGGTYQDTRVGEGAITPENIDGITLVFEPINLLDKTKVTTSAYVDQVDGVQKATGNAGVYCSEYILVEPSTNYTFPKTLALSGAWFDANKNYISGLPVSSSVPITVSSPANAKYVRWNGDNGITPENAMVVKGNALPSSYVAFSPRKYSIEWLNMPGQSRWTGKKIATFGDSITWYDGQDYLASTKEPGVKVKGYQSYMREELGATVINQGVSGDTTPQIDARIKAYDFTGVDAVTILSGTNDFRDMATESIGQIQSIGSTFDNTTFIGAYQEAIEHILTVNPEIKLYLFTPIKGWTDANGLMPEVYPNAIKDLAKLYSLSVCDLYNESGINDLTKATYIVDTDAVAFDFHPSTKGYERMAKIIIPFLENH